MSKIRFIEKVKALAAFREHMLEKLAAIENTMPHKTVKYFLIPLAKFFLKNIVSTPFKYIFYMVGTAAILEIIKFSWGFFLLLLKFLYKIFV